MKLILSRKSLDSSFGKVSNVIFPDGRMCWLPIPEFDDEKSLHRYSDLNLGEIRLGKVVEDLSLGKIQQNTTVHLDPDIFPYYLDRNIQWHPLFGQTGAAESHLRNCNISKGDIFLFFGWFKYIEIYNKSYRFVPKSPDIHAMYGWFQIEKKVKVSEYIPDNEWMSEFTHFQGKVFNSELDTVYFPSKQLILGNKVTSLPGCGYFPQIHEDLILTAPNEKRSVWRLPAWFYPDSVKKPLTYHNNLSRWALHDGFATLKSVGRGQEFVLDVDDYPQSIAWVESMIKNHGVGSILSDNFGE